jgi:hypothetical protein
MALIDWILTILGAWMLTRSNNISFWKALGYLVALAIFMHWLFCVPTKLNTILGLTS